MRLNDQFWGILWITLGYIAFGLLFVWMFIEATGGF